MELGMRNSRGSGFGKMAGIAALGFVAGVAATQAKKVAIQGVSLAAGDWLDALKADHRLVEKLFQTLTATSNDQAIKREMLLTKIAYALTKHGIEEENVVYPALMENGRADMARHLTEDHGQVKTFIYELRRTPTDDARWIDTAHRFFESLQHHVREEEEEVFPAFHAALPDEENARITRMLNWEGFKVA